jgi:hypothetical protein
MTDILELAGVTDDVLAVSIERGAALVGGVTPRHFRKFLDINGGPIRTVRMGTRVLVPISSLREYLQAPAAPCRRPQARIETNGPATVSRPRGALAEARLKGGDRGHSRKYPTRSHNPT